MGTSDPITTADRADAHELACVRIALVAVSYQSYSAAAQLIRSLRHMDLNRVDLTVVLVDNSEERQDQGFGDSAWLGERLLVLTPEQNLGYLGGAQFGLDEYVSRRGSFPDWVIVSNVDLEFRDPAFFAKLRGMDGLDRVGILAPSVSTDTSVYDLNPHLRRPPSRLRMRLYQVMYRAYAAYLLYAIAAMIKARLERLLRGGAQAVTSQQEIYAPHGCFFLLSRAYLESACTLSFPCFLFGEELFLAESARRAGLRVRYVPELAVHHQGHVSTGPIRSPRMVTYMRQSIDYLVSCYFDQNGTQITRCPK